MRRTISFGSIGSPSWSDSSRVSVAVRVGEDVAEKVAGLVDAAQDALLPREHLHRHERISPFPVEDRLGAREVHVGRVAREDLVRRTSTGQPHQSGSAPVCASSRGWVSGGAEVAASVPYASVTGTRSVGTSRGSAEPGLGFAWATRPQAADRRYRPLGAGAATVLVALKLDPEAASSTGLQATSAADLARGGRQPLPDGAAGRASSSPARSASRARAGSPARRHRC